MSVLCFSMYVSFMVDMVEVLTSFRELWTCIALPNFDVNVFVHSVVHSGLLLYGC